LTCRRGALRRSLLMRNHRSANQATGIALLSHAWILPIANERFYVNPP
jgi:hypothetical protein